MMSKMVTVLWLVCLLVLAGCAPAAEMESPAFTGTPSPPARQNLPLLLKQLTPTPVPSWTRTMTPTPNPTMLPDLTIPYVWIVEYDDPCPWGSPGRVTLRIENIGNADAGFFRASVFGDISVYDGLPAGEEAPLIGEFTSGPLGSIYSEADIDDLIMEHNEENNEMLIVFTPPPPCGTPPSP